jgi:hypothetical protein
MKYLDCDNVLISLYYIQLVRYSFANTKVLPGIEPALSRLDRRIFDAIAFRDNTGNVMPEDDQSKLFVDVAQGLREAVASYATWIDRNAVEDPLPAPSYPCQDVFRNNNVKYM